MKKETYVTVISATGKTLEPTNRCGHVRYLLKTGKAKVIRSKPFTIKLLYETPEITQGEVLGIDPGRTNIGLATVKKNGECTGLFHCETRNKDIPKLIQARKEFRMAHRRYRRQKRQRRAIKNHTFHEGHMIERLLPGYETPIVCKEIKNKEARFNNRKRPDGWLTPTANHLLQTHLNLVNKMITIRPISEIVIELNKFSFMDLDAALEGRELSNLDYQQGALYGYEDLEDAVFKQQEGKCLLCGKKRIDHYHHLVMRKDGGSNTIKNIAGLCEECHAKVHKDPGAMAELSKKKQGISKQYAGTSVLNQIIPQLIIRLVDEHPELKVSITSGYETKAFREVNGLVKTHDIDAYCIACSTLEIDEAKIKTNVETQEIRQFRRHDRQCCHQEMVNRNYYLGKKIVATNRRKAIAQTSKSLDEYRQDHTVEEISKLTVKEHPKTYKNRDRVMPGALVRFTKRLTKKERSEGKLPLTKTFIMKGSEGRNKKGNPNMYNSIFGERFGYGSCIVIKKNTGLVYV